MAKDLRVEIPMNTELTTQQAAQLLGVSEPFLIKLLEERKLKFHVSERIGESRPRI